MRALLLFPLLVLALPTAAQPSFGIKVGVNAADISDIDADLPEINGVESQSRLGLTIGLTADVPFTPSLSIRPELLYVQKGYKSSFDVPAGVFDPEQGIEGSVTAEIDYLEVPLLLAYTFPTSSPLEVAVEAGPTLAYKLSTGFSCSGDFEDEGCEDDEFEDEDGLRDFDLGGAVGVTVGSGPFGVGVRYTNSLLSIAKGDEFDTNEDFSPRNQVLTASLMYRFGR